MSDLRSWLESFGIDPRQVGARVSVGRAYVDIVGALVVKDHQGRPADIVLVLDREQLRAGVASAQEVA